MSVPSDKAMQAARAINYFVRGSEDLDIDYASVAEALDSFAADAVQEAVAAERHEIICWICQNHFHEDDLLAFIRARSKPHE